MNETPTKYKANTWMASWWLAAVQITSPSPSMLANGTWFHHENSKFTSKMGSGPSYNLMFVHFISKRKTRCRDGGGGSWLIISLNV